MLWLGETVITANDKLVSRRQTQLDDRQALQNSVNQTGPDRAGLPKDGE